jgi:integrase
VSERPLPIPRPAGLPVQLDRELASAEPYAQSALAPATRRAYESDWLLFAGWCAERGVSAIPAAPAVVAAFLAAEADRGFRPVTVGRRAAAIAAAHRAQDHPNPCDSGAVAQVLSGIRRRHGTAPERRAAPLDLGPLEQVLAELDTATLAGLRDRALLLLGFAAALRRSELVALDVEHLESRPRPAGEDRPPRRPIRSGQERQWPSPTHARETRGARSGRCGRGSRRRGSTAARWASYTSRGTPGAPETLASPAARGRVTQTIVTGHRRASRNPSP